MFAAGDPRLSEQRVCGTCESFLSFDQVAQVFCRSVVVPIGQPHAHQLAASASEDLDTDGFADICECDEVNQVVFILHGDVIE